MKRWLYLLTVLAALPVIPVKADPTSWTLFRGDHRQSGRALSALPQELELLWAVRPTASDSSGAPHGIESTAAIWNGVVYSGNLDGHLYALDLGSGEPLWTFAARDEIKSSAGVAEGRLFFGDESGRFYALDARSGELLWTFDAEAGITSSAHPWSDRVIFGSYDSRVYCLATTDGQLVWRAETEGYVHGTPAILDSTVVTAGCDGFLRRLNLVDGIEKGVVEIGGYVAASCAIDDSGTAYFGTYGNRVLAVDLVAEAIRWRYQHPQRQQPFYASAAIAADLVVAAGRDRILHGLDRKTGQPRWLFDAGARVDSSPVISGERLFFGSSKGSVHALDVGSGKELWRYDTGATIVASAAVADGRLVIGSEDGVLYCFGNPD